MDQISQLLESYFNFRSAVLRSLAYERLSKSAFTRITGLDGNAKYRRQAKPELWKPAEIYILAVEFGQGEANRLERLAELIAGLPPEEKKIALKACLLTEEKLQLRHERPDSWQPQELEKLKRALEMNSWRKRASFSPQLTLDTRSMPNLSPPAPQPY